MFEFEKEKQLGLSQMCNSEDLDVSFAMSFILCVQREKEDHRFAPKLLRAMPRFITAKEARASPLPLQQS